MLKTAYPNFDSEMREKRYCLRTLLMKTDLKYNTMAPKLRKGKNLSLDEALELKIALNSRRNVETLFAKVV